MSIRMSGVVRVQAPREPEHLAQPCPYKRNRLARLTRVCVRAEAPRDKGVKSPTAVLKEFFVREPVIPPTSSSSSSSTSIAPKPKPSPPPRPQPSPPAQPQRFPGPGDPAWPPQRPFAAVALDNLIDSFVDIGRHVRRMSLAEKEETGTLEKGELVPGSNGRMRLRSSSRPVLLVLGSGWGAHSLIKVVDTELYDVVVVSPRNHFLFTPMLPATAVGTVEFRSLLEPIRTANPCVTYLEAVCEEIDPEAKVAVCTSTFAYDDGRKPQFEIQYDKAVVAVGEQAATFGVPGVREHCCFMKEVSDAVGLRARIAQQFELASLPGTSAAERRAALSFVVVGGGPTGVEFAGTLSDFLREDLRRKYPGLVQHVRVTLLQSAQSILTQFDEGLGRQAMETLTSSGVEVRTGVRVVEVTQREVLLEGGERLPYGVCVWSAGNAPRPLVSQLCSRLPAQSSAAACCGLRPGSKLAVDCFLRVVGARELLALGDCSALLAGGGGGRLPPTAQVAAQQGAYLAHLLNSGHCTGEGGYASPPPYKLVRRNRIQTATDNSAALQWLATAMMGGGARLRVAQQVSDALLSEEAPPWIRDHSQDLAATAAAATEEQQRQTGGNSGSSGSDVLEVRYWERPFEFLNLGIMAYLGSDKALTQVEAFDVISLKLYGAFAYLLWKSVYITKQVSFRNRVLILFDWMKTRVFGRDISLF
ncbi:hypothetical protein Agub_g14006 [Astrephomene gubernaculifera]|uniref:NADH:ubiquinone reductase (non-electrogenic) n=1 Tax=Astrephomene gubernaculifera TaxID=47775 RepID=A0AAD3E0S6_9CHLO|nr:hypothetical protein Agub_g14006 [Astrephomene gubernaculifera]